MQIRLVLFLLWLLLPLSSLQAQKVLVCDGATRFPIRDVLVSVDGKNVGLTTWQGTINLPDSFQIATFKKKGYASEKLFRSEVLRDTVFLFPAEHYLDEVVVIGKQVVDGRELLKKMPKRDILEKKPAHSLLEFDVGLMLDKRLRRDRQHVEKLREVFKKMDGLEDKEDPILKAYRQTQLELKADSIQKKNEQKELKK
ncbi:hypothetical protein J4856_11540 [Prevotella scopos JCM 17725]|uniref:PEGA domain-containing protein n=1 Tax=Prevotella scopos JCM 17725 TaxID=1236518 RepID=A0AAX2F3E3_9BACT|nr:hypothetical protein [Prevotella scopos]ANR72433.1 hypothetical protein AXF22_02765 [Prevotella scopos JCM 17725]QUB45358.1 hypothetical protein J4856_11540 [Prevotella scopos JCM 17725]SHF79612.1 hypothetical protein SAMN05444364_11040 [Prevotella scopos JCM 17725]